MPIYEYSCECGALVESIESVGSKRARCGELCVRGAGAAPCSGPAPGEGHVERVLSATGIRGDGKEAREKVFNPVRRSNRPGCEDCS